MSSYTSLYAVPKASFDNYIKYRMGNFPNVKNLKVEQLNFNEAKKLNAIHNQPHILKSDLMKQAYIPYNQDQVNINNPIPYANKYNNYDQAVQNDNNNVNQGYNDQSFNASSIDPPNRNFNYTQDSNVQDHNDHLSSLFSEAAASASNENLLNDKRRTVIRGTTIDTPKEKKVIKTDIKDVDQAILDLGHSVNDMRNKAYIDKNKNPKYNSTPSVKRRAVLNNSNPIAFQTRTAKKKRLADEQPTYDKKLDPKLKVFNPNNALDPNFNVSKQAGQFIKEKADELQLSSKKVNK